MTELAQGCRAGASVGALTGSKNPNWRGGGKSRICKHCNKYFFAKTGNEVASKFFCNVGCWGNSIRRRKIKECPICKKDFSVKASHFEKRVYCSYGCMSLSYKNRMLLQNNPNWRSGISKIKKVRIKKIRIKKVRIKKVRIKKVRILSNSSRAIMKRLTQDERLIFRAEKKRSFRIVRRCPMCLTEFTTWKNRPERHCSRKCYGKAVGLRQIGAASHYWKGGITDWRIKVRMHPLYKEWRTAIFKRDNFTCQSCFKTSADLSKGKLTAHHIVFFKDEPRLALKKSNGITLCWQCHRDFHKMVRNKELPKKEAALTDACREFFKTEPGVFMIKIHGHEFQAAGLPDYIGVVAGVAVGIELKVFPNFSTSLQRHQLKRLSDVGAKTFTCYSIDEVKRVISIIKESIIEGR